MYGFFTFLTFIFMLILLASLVLSVAGWYKPERVLRWGKTKTRSRALLIFIPTIFISFILMSVCASYAQTPEQKAAYEREKSLKAEIAKGQTATQTPAPTPVVQPDKYEIDGISITKPTVKQADVIDIIDGDTIKVKVDGKEETVRFTLVDTPETKDPKTPVEPWGLEASDFTKQQLSGKTVGLEFDAQERDQYGRLLAYVWLGKELFNGTLLDRGFARVAVYPPNTKYVDQFKTIQSSARNGKSGIWSIENYVTDNGFNMDATKPKEQPAAPAPQTVQSNNVFYANCTEAKNAGHTDIKKGEPGYDTKLDRDGDGIACESSDYESSSSSNSAPQPAPQPQPSQPTQSNVSYANCSAVRAAGKAPLHRGDPGYSSKLDRDGDGIACE